MSEQEFDQLLRQALLEAARQETDPRAEDAPDWVPSNRYLQFEQELLADPRKAARRRTRRARPVWRRALRQAACLLLVCAVGFGGWLSVDTGARAAVFNWARTYFAGGDAEYRFYGESALREDGLGADTPLYEFSYLPEGFALVSSNPEDGRNSMAYMKEGEDYILWLQYNPMEEGLAMFVATEGSTEEQIELKGCPADLYLEPDDPEPYNSVVWMDEEAGLCFTVSGPLEREELLRTAESVTLTGVREGFPLLMSPIAGDLGLVGDDARLYHLADRTAAFADLSFPGVGIYAQYEKDGDTWVICRVEQRSYFDCDPEGVFQRTESRFLLLRVNLDDPDPEEVYEDDPAYGEQVRALCADVPGLAERILDGTADYVRELPGPDQLLETYCAANGLDLRVAD